MIIVFVKRCAPAQIHHAQLQMWLAPPMGALEMAAPAEQVHRSTSEWMDTTHLTMLAQCELIFRLLLKMTVGKGHSVSAVFGGLLPNTFKVRRMVGRISTKGRGGRRRLPCGAR